MKISIITVCLNAKTHIEKNLCSVAEQTYDNFEQIIVDGESNDGTLEIIEKFQKQYRHIKLVSEKDDGIYDAMNKGIDLSSGNILYFLNADDRLADKDVLSDVANVFLDNPQLSIVYGNLIWSKPERNYRVNQEPIVSRKLLAEKHIFHQTIFACKDIFNRVGFFSLNYRIVSDYEWELRVFLKNNFNYQHIPRFIAEMDATGLSNSTKFEGERLRAMFSYFTIFEIIKYRIIPFNIKKIFQAKNIINIKNYISSKKEF